MAARDLAAGDDNPLFGKGFPSRFVQKSLKMWLKLEAWIWLKVPLSFPVCSFVCLFYPKKSYLHLSRREKATWVGSKPTCQDHAVLRSPACVEHHVMSIQQCFLNTAFKQRTVRENIFVPVMSWLWARNSHSLMLQCVCRWFKTNAFFL